MKVINIYYRSYQSIVCRVQRLLPWRMPKVISGEGSINKLPAQVKGDGLSKVLVVTTAGFIKRGSLNGLFQGLQKEGIAYAIYDEVKPDPTIDCIEEAVKVYKEEKCEGIIAVGGGSVMDCAKVVGARVVKPNQSVIKMTGLFKILKKLPPLYAVPTTAGTGSEVTVAAVITDSRDHCKYPVNDLCLMPLYAVLDPGLTLGLPKNMTATTGMDALTHAVEAYTNKYSSAESKKYAIDAVKLIFANITKAYDDGNDIKARENMLMGSFYAGAAFTKAYVGYVHALAHGIGGLYGVPHGLANAVLLPVVMESYGSASYKELAELADTVGIEGSTLEEKAKKFIQKIRSMNEYMGIPDRLDAIEKKDIPELIRRAMREANPTYPVPVIWDSEQFRKIIEKC